MVIWSTTGSWSAGPLSKGVLTAAVGGVVSGGGGPIVKLSSSWPEVLR
jgi:hypothetical protein